MEPNQKVKAVELVRRIRDEQHEALKAKSSTERRQYYRTQAEALHRKLDIRAVERSKA